MPAQMIKKKLVVQAVSALRNTNENFFKDSSKKKPLLCSENESPVFLNVQLKKIPKLKSIKMIKVQLPHRLLKDTSEVCLIAGDLDKRNPKAEIEPDILHYKELLEKHDIHCISEVVTLRQLRTEYKPYEAKQKLLAAYDRFLNDNRITECLPKVLGRHFFQKKKFPIQIKINTSNLKQQVEKALSTSIFNVSGHGNSCSAEVAYLDMDDSEIIENVMAVVNTLSSQLPGSWDNVMGVYLKTARSVAVPIYVSYDDPNKVVLENEVEDDSYEIDELSSIPNVNVKVYKSGKVATVRIKEESKSDNVKSEKEDLANDTQTSVESKEKKKDSDSEVITFKKELSKSSVHIKKSKRSKQQTSSNSFTCVEDSLNDTQNKAKVMDKKSRKKKKSSQESFTFENDEIESKNLKSALKRKRDRSLLTEEKNVSSLPSKKNKKIEDFQSKKLNGHKENKKGKKKKGNHL